MWTSAGEGWWGGGGAPQRRRRWAGARAYVGNVELLSTMICTHKSGAHQNVQQITASRICQPASAVVALFLPTTTPHHAMPRHATPHHPPPTLTLTRARSRTRSPALSSTLFLSRLNRQKQASDLFQRTASTSAAKPGDGWLSGTCRRQRQPEQRTPHFHQRALCTR